MNSPTLLPEALTAMTVAQIQALPAEQLQETQHHLAELAQWLKTIQTKVHAALEQRYQEPLQAAQMAAGKDFGVVHFRDGAVRVTVDTPKRVRWDQEQLAVIARRIVASGGRVEDYLQVEFSISEAEFHRWPMEKRVVFEGARTVKPGKSTFRLTVSEDI